MYFESNKTVDNIQFNQSIYDLGSVKHYLLVISGGFLFRPDLTLLLAKGKVAGFNEE